MADTKSKAQKLATALENFCNLWDAEVAAELRHLDAVVDGLNRLHITRVQENAEQLRQILALTAERDALQAEVERLRADADRMTWLEQAAALLVSANDRPMRDWLMARPAGAGNLRAAIDAARGAS